MQVSASAQQLARRIRERMVERGWTLASAESCTSGRVAAMLTSISGASDYFQGSLVAYQDHLKVQHLGVRQDDIDQHDVVSQPVVEQMVRGCCALFHTDLAVASTGYTGAGSQRVPAGTVWLAWGSADEVHSVCITTGQERESNTQMAAERLLTELYNYLCNK